MDIRKDFTKYAISSGVSSLKVDNYFSSIENTLTPYILEERELRATQIDVFSRLMRDRIIWVSGVVNDNMSTVVQAQLMYLDSVQKLDITMHVDSPGGSVKSGLSMIDVMNYVNSDIQTINTGMAASMGSVILSSGTKGKRSSLLHSKVMTHMVSSQYGGNIQDTSISHLESHKYNYILFNILAKNCGKTFEEMIESSRRDRWFDSKEALDFGLIDEVIGLDKDNNMMDGFENYYKNEVLNR